MSAEHVLTMLNEHEVKFVDLRFTDTKGKEQHVTIPSHQVNAEFFEEGKMFDGSSIGGWKGINESDMVLMPDAWTCCAATCPRFPRTCTFRKLWASSRAPTARNPWRW